jgi:hypothetical protein
MSFGRIIVPAMLIASGVGYFSDQLSTLRLPAVAQTSRSASCIIKGNISIETGERIYHVPGQRYYDATRISPRYGERWFCTEAEAEAAGWRKARE